MRLVDYLDKGTSLGPDAPCLTTDGDTRTYGQVQAMSYAVGAALEARLHVRIPDDLRAFWSEPDLAALAQIAGIDGVRLSRRPEVNSVFASLPRPAIDQLQAWSFFWDWDVHIDEVRWMTSWATDADDIAAFVAGVRAVCPG